MKSMRRLSFLVLVLALSVLAIPDAFGGKGGGGVGRKLKNPKAQSQEYCDYYIWCNDGREACCYGDLGFCWDACEWYCGGPCVYYGT